MISLEEQERQEDIIRKFTRTLCKLGIVELDLEVFNNSSVVHLYMDLKEYWLDSWNTKNITDTYQS